MLPTIKRVADELDADIFLLSGDIDRNASLEIIECQKESQKRKNCVLILTTSGGDPDAAFIIGKHLQTNYEKFTAFVFGYCKSAGTLIVLGAHEIVMSEHGELGPLDVQIRKDDDLVRQSSGLDIFQALNIVSSQAFLTFEEHFLQIVGKSFGSITTKTAADIAASIASSLMSPIMEQVDPMKLGEVQRAINIASEYGTRLGRKVGITQDCIQKLIYNYPTHGFVIDYEEAKDLFPCVRFRTDDEYTLEIALHSAFNENCIWHPSEKQIILYLNDIRNPQENENESADTQSEESEELALPSAETTAQPSNDDSEKPSE